jgi:hypothetical protein
MSYPGPPKTGGGRKRRGVVGKARNAGIRTEQQDPFLGIVNPEL